TTSGSAGQDEHWARTLQRAVMTGVSYMVPFVAGGGLLMALGFLLGGYDVSYAWEALSTEASLGNLPGEIWTLDGEIVGAGTARAWAPPPRGSRCCPAVASPCISARSCSASGRPPWAS